MKQQIIENDDGERFVKVRVPVVVDAEGRWEADGFYSRTRDEAANTVAETADGLGFDHVRRIYFLYALVPVPDRDDMPEILALRDEGLRRHVKKNKPR